MRYYLNIFASLFLLSSVVVCGFVFTRIFTNAESNGSPQTAKVLSDTTIANNSTDLSPQNSPTSQVIVPAAQIRREKSWLENVFSWKLEPYKLSTSPEIYFDEDARFYKKITVDEEVFFGDDLRIGGGLWVDEDATFDEDVTIKGEKVEINGVKYYWPDEQGSGSLVNDGSGRLSWSSIAGGISNFLGLSDTPDSYSGGENFLLGVNGTGTGLEFLDPSGFGGGGGVDMVSNSDGTLTISPTAGNVVASLNLNNSNTWTAAQIFSGGLLGPGDSGFNASGRLGLGTTDASSLLTMVGGSFTHTAAGNPTLKGGSFSANNGRGIYVSGRYAYMAVNTSGVMIYDINNPSSPTLVSTFDTSGNALDVHVVGRYMYIADGTEGLIVVDVSDPTSPVRIGQYDTGHQSYGVYISGSYAYIADFDDGLVIVDISNGYKPTFVGQYNTSGNSISVFVTGNYAYVADNTSGLQIIDVSDPANPTLTGTYNTPSNANDVYVAGDYAYIADNTAGLHIVNVRNPASPTLASTYNTDSFASGVHVAGKYAYVADWDKLEIIDVSVPTAPVYIGGYDSPYITNRVFVAGKYAYITANGIQIVDLNGIETPTLAAGNISAGELNVSENGYINNDLFVGNGINVGAGGANFSGKVGVGVSSAFTALKVNQMGSGNIFDIFNRDKNVFSIINNGNVGIGTTAPAYMLDVAGIARVKALLSDTLIFSNSSASILSGVGGLSGYTNFTGGIGTGGVDSLMAAQRLTAAGNLKNIGSIQAGETHLTSGGTFAAKVDYSAGDGPWSVKMADFNGDGYLDLVTANSNDEPSTMSVILNNRNGTFASPVLYPTGDTPEMAMPADVNGDGWMDIVVANRNDSTISVFFNDGDGTFTLSAVYPTGFGPSQIAAGDLNGDGMVDLAIENSGTGSMSVLLNNGNGTFAGKVDYSTGGVSARAIAMGDINGDGFAEVFTVDQSNAQMSVFINSGNGTFPVREDYSTVDFGARGVVVSDLNGDGLADLAVVNSSASSVSVFLNDGDGDFLSSVEYSTDGGPNYLSVGDLNGDGFPDLVTSNSFPASSMSVLINNGNGTFATNVDYVTASGPHGVAIGDLNNDGKADIVTSNNAGNNVSVFINQTSTIFYADASTGNVGIGTTAPGSKLSIANLGTGSGTTLVIDANGNVFRDSSSERYKMDIEPLAVDFAKVLELQPKSYKFKDSGLLSIGYIAEEVDRLGGLSDLLIYDSNGEVDGFKYDRLPIYTLEIVKDLNDRVTALEAKLGMEGGTVLGSESTKAEGKSDSSDSDYFGIIVVEADGDVSIENSLRVKGLLRAAKVNIDTSSEAIGRAVIRAGEESIKVGSSTITLDSLIFVTPDEPVTISAKKTDYDEFEIRLDKAYDFDININWVVIN